MSWCSDSALPKWVAKHWKDLLVEWIFVFGCLWAVTQIVILFADEYLPWWILPVSFLASLLIAVLIVCFGPPQLRVSAYHGRRIEESPRDLVMTIQTTVRTVYESTGSFSDFSELAGSLDPVENTKIVRITDFWRNAKEYKHKLVEIKGTVSQYSPFVIGPPDKKRQKHLELRHEKEISSGTLNLLLAFTAGQMVWTLAPTKEFYFLGLYQSIVRNSIPLVVSKDYYESLINDRNYGALLEAGTFETKTFDATVCGRVVRLPLNFAELYREWDLVNSTSGVQPTIFEDVGEIYAIMVDSNAGFIEKESETMYLDGDVWIAIEFEGQQSLESRFCDLSNEDDIKDQIKDLKTQLDKDKPGYRIVYRFDQANSEEESVVGSTDDMTRRILKKNR